MTSLPLGELTPIERSELAELVPEGWGDTRVLHVQCGSGESTLILADSGATVVGVDVARTAIHHARARATELGLAEVSRFVEADLYDLRHILPEPEGFDIVLSTWGSVLALPDLGEWAKLVTWYLKPGGLFYLADNIPSHSSAPLALAAIERALVAAGLELAFAREHAGSVSMAASLR